MDRGGDPIPHRSVLEAADVEEHKEYGALAVECKTQQRFIEYWEGLRPEITRLQSI